VGPILIVDEGAGPLAVPHIAALRKWPGRGGNRLEHDVDHLLQVVGYCFAAPVFSSVGSLLGLVSSTTERAERFQAGRSPEAMTTTSTTTSWGQILRDMASFAQEPPMRGRPMRRYVGQNIMTRRGRTRKGGDPR